jgi:RNA polymerase sigma factor (sigma-70 family)
VSEQHPGTLVPVDEPGDAELISTVRAGDVDAYGLLFARHVDAARRLARQLVSAGDVDDLVSEAFAKVLSVLQRGGGPDLAFRAYLLTSVRRLHVDKLRGAARLQTTDDLTPYDPGVPFEDTAVAGFENATAAKAFASLPERWQQVLWHTEVEGQKPAEVAPLLGMTPNSVSALAYRAREGLRQAFVTMHAQEVVDDHCSTTRANLGGYLRGGLSRRDSGKVEGHLQDCRPCSAIYLELSEVNADLGAVLAPILLGSAGAGYLAAAHVGAVAAAKAGILLFWDRAKDWLLHDPVGRVTAGVSAAAVAAVAITAGIQLTGSPERPVPAPSAPPSGPAASSLPQPPAGDPAPPQDEPAPESTPTTAPTPAPAAAPVPSNPPSPQTSAATNSAPVIAIPLPAVTVSPDGDSVVIDLTRGAHDADGDPLQVESARVKGTPRHGTVRIGGTAARTSAPGAARTPTAALARAPFGAAPATERRGSGSVTYTPDPSWRGTEVIAYVLTDGERTVDGTVRVTTPNRRPAAVDDTRTVHVGSIGQPVEIAVLDNDTDANRDPLTVTSVGAVVGLPGGTASVAPDGRHVTYLPDDAGPGSASFGYTTSDGHGGTATATVTVSYGNVAPSAAPDTATTPDTGDRSVVVDVLANDTDPDGDPVNVQDLTQPAHGHVLAEGDSLRYTPDDTFDGTDSFSYVAADSYGGTATATVTVTAVEPHSSFDLGDDHVDQDSEYLFSRPTVAGIPAGRHATATVTVRGFLGWSSNDITLSGCGGWSADGDTLTLVCHLGAEDNDARLGHFDAYASSIELSATADDFDAADATLTLAPPASTDDPATVPSG